MTWGLVPSWTKKEEKLDFFRMFNARSETVPEKTVFSRLLGSKRCVVLLNGFYEWAQVSSNSYIENTQSIRSFTLVQAAVLRYHHPY
jgi:putative SOS response-associated peptidase YedK